jgi:hypothetical protein
VVVTDQRTAVDWAQQIRNLVDVRYPRAERITLVISTLSDYMIYPFQVRHSGRDCRNPDSTDGFELAIHGTGYPLPGEYDEPVHNLTK